MVDHGIHVASGDPKEKIGATQCGKGGGGSPVGLCNHAYPETLCFQHAANDGHAKARVIDVSVSRHNDDVATIPPQRFHLFTRHGQPGRRTEAFGPVLSVIKKGCRLILHDV